MTVEDIQKTIEHWAEGAFRGKKLALTQWN